MMFITKWIWKAISFSTSIGALIFAVMWKMGKKDEENAELKRDQYEEMAAKYEAQYADQTNAENARIVASEEGKEFVEQTRDEARTSNRRDYFSRDSMLDD